MSGLSVWWISVKMLMLVTAVAHRLYWLKLIPLIVVWTILRNCIFVLCYLIVISCFARTLDDWWSASHSRYIKLSSWCRCLWVWLIMSFLQADLRGCAILWPHGATFMDCSSRLVCSSMLIHIWSCLVYWCWIVDVPFILWWG